MTTAWYGTQYSDRKRQLREYHKAQFYRSTGLSRTTSEVGMSSFTVSLLVGRRDLELFQRAMRTRPASSPSFVCPRAINARAPVPGLPGSASAPVLSCDGSSLQNDDVSDTCAQLGSTSSDVAEQPDVMRHRPMHYGTSDSKQAPELITSSLSGLFMLNRDQTSFDRQPTRIRPFRRLPSRGSRSTHDSMTSRSGGMTSQISVDDCGPLAQRLKVRHHAPAVSCSSSGGSIHQMAPLDESTTNLDQQFSAETSGDVFEANQRRSTSGDDYVASDVINCREASPPGGSTSDSSDGGRCEAGACPPSSDLQPRSDAAARQFAQMPPIGAPPSPTKFAARGRSNRTGNTRDATAVTIANNGLKYRLGCCGYPDPVAEAPLDFQQRICEIQLLQLETIRSEKMRRSIVGTTTSAAAAAAAAAVQRRMR